MTEHYIEEVESTRRYRGLITHAHEKIREYEQKADKAEDTAQGQGYAAVALLVVMAVAIALSLTVADSVRPSLYVVAGVFGGAGLVFAGFWLVARSEGKRFRRARLSELVDIDFYAERLCAMTEQLEELAVELDRPTPKLDRLLNEEDEVWTPRDATS